MSRPTSSGVAGAAAEVAEAFDCKTVVLKAINTEIEVSLFVQQTRDHQTTLVKQHADFVSQARVPLRVRAFALRETVG